MLAVDGISDFNPLHFGKRNDEVQPCAFDILAEGGDEERWAGSTLSGRSIEVLAVQGLRIPGSLNGPGAEA